MTEKNTDAWDAVYVVNGTLCEDESKRLCPIAALSPCWATVADAADGGLELWVGIIFLIATGLPCPASSGPAPPVAMRATDGFGATGG